MTRLREINEVALFVSCGEISEVKYENGEIIIQTDKKYLAELISEEQNMLALKRALRFWGYDLKIKVEHIEGKKDIADKDIDFLKQKLGGYLKIT